DGGAVGHEDDIAREAIEAPRPMTCPLCGGWCGRGVLWAFSWLCAEHLAGLPARKQGPIVRPYVRRAAPEGLLQLVDDPVRELLRGGEHLEDVPAALDRHDLPLGLREARARCNVPDAPADGAPARRGTTADEDPPEVLLAPPLLARGTHHPRGPRQQG